MFNLFGEGTFIYVIEGLTDIAVIVGLCYVLQILNVFKKD